MSAMALFSPATLTDFRAAGVEPVAVSGMDRLQGWLAEKSRVRLAAAERALVDRLWSGRPGVAITLDGERGSAAGHMARLRSARNGHVDAVITVGALAGAVDVALMLMEIKRVLRPGGRLLFVEPVAAPAGTRRRAFHTALDRLWRVVAGVATAPRDLWNDLKAARFARLTFHAVNLPGVGGVPVPHLVGEASMPTAPATAQAVTGSPPRDRAVPRLSWSAPPFAFFGR
jgi:SAM-dependent methyltransferase